jgi:hypothetical protein
MDTVGFRNYSHFFIFLPPFRFPTEIHLSLNRVSEENIVCVGPLNRSIGLEKDRWKAKEIW